MQPFKCPVCDGTGKNKKIECRPCRGEGIVWGPKGDEPEQVKLIPYPVPYPQPYTVYPTWPRVRPYWIASDPVWAGSRTIAGTNTAQAWHGVSGTIDVLGNTVISAVSD